MKKSLIVASLAFLAVACGRQQESVVKTETPFNDTYPIIGNIPARQAQSLDGTWTYIVDPMRNGGYDYRNAPLDPAASFFADASSTEDLTKLVEYDFELADEIQVPGDWNTQKEKLYYYEGMVWYRRTFEAVPEAGKRYFLHFGAVNYEAKVGLNGKIVGHHRGGFTPFEMEVTDCLRPGRNSLVVMVDNVRKAEAVPTTISDWWNYGGITRSVSLLEMPADFVRNYYIQYRKGEIFGWVQLDGKPGKVNVSIPELGIASELETNAEGRVEFSVPATPELWSPENPKLYAVTVSSASDKVEDRIGFKTVKTEGRKLLLNGKEIFCKGVSIHEEQLGPGGRVTTAQQAKALLDEAKALGCNFVRLAHYPHNEDMVRLAEEMGLMVWSEIPCYWTIAWTNPETYRNTETQLSDMIARDQNRANIVIWSVANETPISEERNAFLFSLIDKARELDPTRLVSAAMEVHHLGNGHVTVDDPLLQKADLISFNEYMGWYGTTSEACDTTYFTFETEKPVFISEFGAGCVAGRHGKVTDRWTEEYMADLYRHNTDMLEKRVEGLVGTTPWVLKDFRSFRRVLRGTQDDYNRKGLMSETGVRKSAFYVLKDWYDTK